MINTNSVSIFWVSTLYMLFVLIILKVFMGICIVLSLVLLSVLCSGFCAVLIAGLFPCNSPEDRLLMEFLLGPPDFILVWTQLYHSAISH